MKTPKQNSAVTLVEILIATTVFSLFMVAVFDIFRSSQKGYDNGSWRLKAQKQAQLFLLRFKEVAEKANHAYEVSAQGSAARVGDVRPIYIDKNWFNTTADCTNGGIMFFSINTPSILPLPEFGQPRRPGKWKGVGLECKNNTLRCYSTGAWNKMPNCTPVKVGSPDVTKFEIDKTDEDFSISLQDVEKIGIFVKPASGTEDLRRPELFMTLEVTLKKPRTYQNVSLTEKITAKIQDRKETEINTVTPGTFKF